MTTKNSHILIEDYNARCAAGEIEASDEQRRAIVFLQAIFTAVINSLQSKWRLLRFMRPPLPIHGLYLWGSVGSGKTLLMDRFFYLLPIQHKKRFHFHAFMQRVHEGLHSNRGIRNPIPRVVDDIIGATKILCFDEMLVTDITDAMLLRHVLRALFEKNITLVMTANTPPDRLYWKGLQRSQFLPAIADLKKHLHVFELSTPKDYRLRLLELAGTAFIQDPQAEQKMAAEFAMLVKNQLTLTGKIFLLGREVRIIKSSDKYIWFDFKVLIKPPRSQQDYLFLAKHYTCVFLSNIPHIRREQHDVVNLFIRFIDVLYDTGTPLIFSTHVPLEEIYTEGRMLQDFQRTLSRLYEMQTKDFFTKKVQSPNH